MINKLARLTEKQRRLVCILRTQKYPDFDEAAERLGITKRSVYRLAAGIKKRIGEEAYGTKR